MKQLKAIQELNAGELSAESKEVIKEALNEQINYGWDADIEKAKSGEYVDLWLGNAQYIRRVTDCVFRFGRERELALYGEEMCTAPRFWQEDFYPVDDADITHFRPVPPAP